MDRKINISAEGLRVIVGKAISSQIELRRASLEQSGKSVPEAGSDVNDDEITDFIIANPLYDEDLKMQLIDPGLLGFHQKFASTTQSWLQKFSENSHAWASNNDYLAGDDTFGNLENLLFGGVEPERTEVFSDPKGGFVGELVRSPSLIFLARNLVAKGVPLHEMDARRFEELLAELLQADGWQVEVTPFSSDGGVDVVAVRQVPLIGTVRTVWQAKRYDPSKSKVGLSSIRELAASTRDFSATKGVVATTSMLTSGALRYVEQNQYLLGKAEHDDMMDWLLGRKRIGMPDDDY